MVIKVKKRIISIFLPIIVAIIMGAITGGLISRLYMDDTSNTLTSSVVYVVECGDYDTLEGMKLSSSNGDYTYYNDNGTFKKVVGITKKEENVSKIIDIYGNDVKVSKYFLMDKDLDKKLTFYDLVLGDTTDKDEIRSVIQDMLNYYKDKKIKLLEIN